MKVEVKYSFINCPFQYAVFPVHYSNNNKYGQEL